MSEFEITEIHSFRVVRSGTLVAELTKEQWDLVMRVAELSLDRIEGIKLLRAISSVQKNDPWGLETYRDLLDAART